MLFIWRMNVRARAFLEYSWYLFSVSVRWEAVDLEGGGTYDVLVKFGNGLWSHEVLLIVAEAV
jgi:hypothetical protein